MKWSAASTGSTSSRRVDHWKASGVDLSNVLREPAVSPDAARHQTRSQDHALDDDPRSAIIAAAWPAIEGKAPVRLRFPIRNANRATGTMLGYEITRRHGGAGCNRVEEQSAAHPGPLFPFALRFPHRISSLQIIRPVRLLGNMRFSMFEDGEGRNLSAFVIEIFLY